VHRSLNLAITVSKIEHPSKIQRWCPQRPLYPHALLTNARRNDEYLPLIICPFFFCASICRNCEHYSSNSIFQWQFTQRRSIRPRYPLTVHIAMLLSVMTGHIAIKLQSLHGILITSFSVLILHLSYRPRKNSSLPWKHPK
jgi:hypothetical protein